MTTTALTPAQQRHNKLTGEIERLRPVITQTLPDPRRADRFIRIVLNAPLASPKLLDCKPSTVVMGALQAAALGLEVGTALGQAYLVPYGNTATLIIGYQGFVQLAYNTGLIAGVDAECVRDGDEFKWEQGTAPFLKHKPADDNDDAPVTHVWACARLVNGGSVFRVLTHAQVEKVRKVSRAGSRGPWVDHWDEMAKKTVFRRLQKFLPKASERAEAMQAMATALRIDAEADEGVPQTLDVEAERVPGEDDGEE